VLSWASWVGGVLCVGRFNTAVTACFLVGLLLPIGATAMRP